MSSGLVAAHILCMTLVQRSFRYSYLQTFFHETLSLSKIVWRQRTKKKERKIKLSRAAWSNKGQKVALGMRSLGD